MPRGGAERRGTSCVPCTSPFDFIANSKPSRATGRTHTIPHAVRAVRAAARARAPRSEPRSALGCTLPVSRGPALHQRATPRGKCKAPQAQDPRVGYSMHLGPQRGRRRRRRSLGVLRDVPWARSRSHNVELGATSTHGAQDRLKHVIRPRLPPLLRALDTEPVNLAALHLIGPAIGRAVLKRFETHRALDLR